MNAFRSEKPEPRSHCVTLRMTATQNELLNQIVEALGESKGELLRIALDYWLENSPEAKRILKRK